MAAYLLDTNHASPLVTLSHPLRQVVSQALQANHTFSICVPVLTETLYGIGILPRAKQNLAEWARLKPSIQCYVPDEDDAQFAAELQLSLRRRGRQLETVDALIATIAFHYDLTLLTSDNDFQAVSELKLENWLK
jgi:predicted nucleic acid-binding protein